MTTCSVHTITTTHTKHHHHHHPSLRFMGSGTGSHSGSGSGSNSPPPIKTEPQNEEEYNPPASTPSRTSPVVHSPPVGLLNHRNLVQDEKLVVATLASFNSGDPSNIIKQDLRLIIQSRRKAEGKGELQVDFKTPPKDELTEEEWEKVRKRRDQNRLAAQRFRQKQRKLSSVLSDQQLTSEELEKRARRRELNRLAAKRSREKGQRRKETLIQEIQGLQARNGVLEGALGTLVEERDNLVRTLKGHLPRCQDSSAMTRSAQLLAFSHRLAQLLDWAIPGPGPDPALVSPTADSAHGLDSQSLPPVQSAPHTPLSAHQSRDSSAHHAPTSPSTPLGLGPGSAPFPSPAGSGHHPPPDLPSPSTGPSLYPVRSHTQGSGQVEPMTVARDLEIDVSAAASLREEIERHHHRHPFQASAPVSPTLSSQSASQHTVFSPRSSPPAVHPGSQPMTPTHLFPSPSRSLPPPLPSPSHSLPQPLPSPSHSLPPPLPSPSHSLPPPLPSPSHSLPPHLPSPSHSLPPPLPSPSHSLPPHLPSPSHSLPPHLPSPSHSLPPPLPSPSHSLPPHLPSPSHSLPPPLPSPSHSLPPHLPSPSHSLPPPLPSPSHSLPPPVPSPSRSLPPHLPSPSHSLPPPLPSPSHSLPPPLPSPSHSLPPHLPSPSHSLPPHLPSPSHSLPPHLPSPHSLPPPHLPSPSHSLPPFLPSPSHLPSPSRSLPPFFPSPSHLPSPTHSLPLHLASPSQPLLPHLPSPSHLVPHLPSPSHRRPSHLALDSGGASVEKSSPLVSFTGTPQEESCKSPQSNPVHLPSPKPQSQGVKRPQSLDLRGAGIIPKKDPALRSPIIPKKDPAMRSPVIPKKDPALRSPTIPKKDPALRSPIIEKSPPPPAVSATAASSSSTLRSGGVFKRGPVQRVASFHGVLAQSPGEQMAPLNLSKRRKSEDYGSCMVTDEDGASHGGDQGGVSGLHTWPPPGVSPWVKQEEETDRPLNLVCREQPASAVTFGQGQRDAAGNQFTIVKKEGHDDPQSDESAFTSVPRRLMRFSSYDGTS